MIGTKFQTPTLSLQDSGVDLRGHLLLHTKNLGGAKKCTSNFFSLNDLKL